MAYAIQAAIVDPRAQVGHRVDFWPAPGAAARATRDWELHERGAPAGLAEW